MKRNRLTTLTVCLVMLICMFAVTAFAADCSHVPAEAVQENIVNSTYTKGGSYELVEYCDACGEELSRTQVKSDKKILPKVEGIVTEAISSELIKVTWGYVEGADGYRLFMLNHDTNEFETVKTITSGNVVSAGVNDVYLAAENIFMVKAYVKENGKTIWSSESESVSVHVKPPVPKNITYTATATEITVKWDKTEGANGYEVYKRDDINRKYVKIATVDTNKYVVDVAEHGTGLRIVLKAYKNVDGKVLRSNATDPVYVVAKPATVTSITYKSSAEGVSLIWQQVRPASGYRIYQYNSKAKKWVSIKTVNQSTYTGTQKYTVEGLSGGTYKFRIQTFRKSGGNTIWGDASKTVNVKAAPAEVKNFVASSQTTTSLKLSWKKTQGAQGYRIYIYDTAAKEWKKLKTTSELTCKVKNLKPGTMYEFRITAYRKINGETVWGNTSAAIATVTKPAAVTGVKASASSTDSIKLSWKAVKGVTGYRILKYNPNTKKWENVKTTAGTSYTLKKLKSATTYKFRVKAYIQFEGKTYWSDATPTITAVTKPAKVTPVVKSSAPGQITLTWKAVSGAKLYRVYYKLNDGKYKLYKTYSAPQTLTFKNLNGGDKYTFAIRAEVTAGNKTVLSDVLAKSVKVTYRTTRYLNTMKSGTYYTRYKVSGVEFAEAIKGNMLYTIAYDENGEQNRMVYNGSQGKWYYIYDQYKAYVVVNDSDLPAELRGGEVIKAARDLEIRTPYKSTKQEVDGQTMFCEWIKHDDGEVAYINYCFSGTTLKKAYMDMVSGLVIEQEYLEFTNKVPDSLFTIPSDYQCAN